jgi:transposase
MIPYFEVYAHHSTAQLVKEALASPGGRALLKRLRKNRPATVDEKLDALLKRTAGAPTSAVWLTTAQVATRVGVGKSTIERLKAHAEQHGVSGPWAYVGRRLLWQADLVDEFIKETSQWRGSKNAAGKSKSDGETSRARNVGGRAQASASPKRSGSKSKTASRAGGTGTLRSLAASLSLKT